MHKNKADLIINNRTYSIVGNESEDYLYRVGVYVDKKIKEIAQAHTKLSTSDVAVLAAVNIADELLKLRDEHSIMDERIAQIIGDDSSEKNEIIDQKQKGENLAEIKKVPALSKAQTTTDQFFNNKFKSLTSK